MRTLTLAAVLCLAFALPASAQKPVPDWKRIKEVARACRVTVIRKQLPPGLKGVKLGLAYRFAPKTPQQKRQCFYRSLPVTEVERILHEGQFERR